MDMLERYLQAVRFFLPAHLQEDIVRELSENLISQMEDREEELGRPLDEAEQAAILQRHGHPMIVAGRYRSQQQLIGPVFFPLYLFVLKTGLAAALLVNIVVAIGTAALHGDPLRHFLETMLGFPGRALIVFAWVTLAFAALDFAQARLKLTHAWDPRTLPKVVRHEHQIPRHRTLVELFVVLAGLVWLLLLPRSPFLILGPAAAFVEFAPGWQPVFVAMVLLTVASAALHIVDFVRPYWTRPRALMRLGINVAWLAVFARLARTNEWFLARFTGASVPDGVQLDHVVKILNGSFQIGFLVAAIITVIEIIRGLYRLKHGPPLSSKSAAARAGH